MGPTGSDKGSKGLLIVATPKGSAPPLSPPEDLGKAFREFPTSTGNAMDGECGTCKYFGGPEDGRCLRYPPHGPEWAMVNEEDACGEYEAGMPRKPHSPHQEEMEQEPDGMNLGAAALGGKL